jgi:hypothetical protein
MIRIKNINGERSEMIRIKNIMSGSLNMRHMTSVTKGGQK